VQLQIILLLIDLTIILKAINAERVYIPKKLINVEGSCFFWKHSFGHTFSSNDCKQCLDIQLLKFENMILLGRTFCKVVHITYI